MDTEPRLNLDEIQSLIHSDRFIGPIEPIKDPRLAAALLFHRYNDGTIRTLFTDQEQPYISVAIHHDFSLSRPTRPIMISKEVVDQLREKCLIKEHLICWRQWRLSDRGKKMVIEQWVTPDSIIDVLMASAIIDLGAGEISWTH